MKEWTNPQCYIQHRMVGLDDMLTIYQRDHQRKPKRELEKLLLHSNLHKTHLNGFKHGNHCGDVSKVIKIMSLCLKIKAQTPYTKICLVTMSPCRGQCAPTYSRAAAAVSETLSLSSAAAQWFTPSSLLPTSVLNISEQLWCATLQQLAYSNLQLWANLDIYTVLTDTWECVKWLCWVTATQRTKKKKEIWSHFYPLLPSV